jgi:hypothetical protein
LDPKGHNKNNCPQILSTICTLCVVPAPPELLQIDVSLARSAFQQRRQDDRQNCNTVRGTRRRSPSRLATLPNFRMYVTARLAHSSVFRFHPTNNYYDIVKHSLPFATSMHAYVLCSSPAQPGLRTQPARQR